MGDRYKVPIYAHTAGMNRYCGDPNYSFGEDPKIVYLLAALEGNNGMTLVIAGGLGTHNIGYK